VSICPRDASCCGVLRPALAPVWRQFERRATGILLACAASLNTSMALVGAHGRNRNANRDATRRSLYPLIVYQRRVKFPFVHADFSASVPSRCQKFYERIEH